MGNTQKKKKKRLLWKKKRTEIVNRRMAERRKEIEPEIKLLILGTGDSGKSTFVKQVQILFKDGFTDKHRQDFRNAIRFNLIDHTKRLIEICDNLGIKIEDQDIAEDFMYITAKEPNEEIAEQIRTLWGSEGSALRRAFKRRSEFQVPDTAAFFLDDIDRIVAKDYMPTIEDILKCRIPTTGIKTIEFELGGLPWKVVDVGGQRSERRKWIHHFADVNVLIFVSAISEYDQKLYEDESMNRIHESLDLFEKTINNEYFRNKDVVLLFNKYDLFLEKIPVTCIDVCFPKYKGEKHNPIEAREYIRSKFLSKVKNSKNRKVPTDFLIATETSHIKKVFRLIREVLGMELSVEEESSSDADQ